MYTPTQLEAIKIFGKKELTNGCIITYKNQIGTIIGKKGVHFLITYEKQWKEFETKIGEISRFFIEEDCEILGHEPHLEDVFRVAEENGYIYNCMKGRLHIFKQYMGGVISSTEPIEPSIDVVYQSSIPLLEQSESTLQELISLFK